ncbi:hypothetical protein B0H14DRAFT_2606974 [Mycena olivaceomarginata]|nr:hypothetical protein B0H14DRAFT_2606974 [Mycena olivaceomarginata]
MGVLLLAASVMILRVEAWFTEARFILEKCYCWSVRGFGCGTGRSDASIMFSDGKLVSQESGNRAQTAELSWLSRVRFTDSNLFSGINPPLSIELFVDLTTAGVLDRESDFIASHQHLVLPCAHYQCLFPISEYVPSDGSCRPQKQKLLINTELSMSLDSPGISAFADRSSVSGISTTHNVFDADGFLLTGDMANMSAEGYQVSPAELEAHLLSLELGDSVISRPSERCGEVPVTFIVLSGLGRDRDLDSVKDVIEHSVKKTKSIPRLPSGKIIGSRLKEMLNTVKPVYSMPPIAPVEMLPPAANISMRLLSVRFTWRRFIIGSLYGEP